MKSPQGNKHKFKIPQEMSEVLRKYTTHPEAEELSKQTGIGIATLRGVMYRKWPLTKTNSKGFIELAKLGLKKAKAEQELSRKASENLEAEWEEYIEGATTDEEAQERE